jgi:hypothetical protein
MNVLKKSLEKFKEFVEKGALKNHSESEARLAEGWFIEGYAFGFEAAQIPPPPMECKTDAEKIAYSYGWFKALELNPARKLWVGLTDDDRKNIHAMWVETDELTDEQDVVDFVEKLLKEKNT